MKNSLFGSVGFYYQILGHIFFLAFFIFSIIFFRERIIYIDSASYITQIIQTEQFNISGRYSDVFSQALPLLAVKTGLSLKAVLIIYSASFILLFYSIFLICVYKLKNTFAGMAIVLVLCLCTRDTFYYAVTEIHQGLVFSVLFWAVLEYEEKIERKYLFLIYSLFLIILCFYSHPATFFTLFFLVLFSMIDKKKYTYKPYWIFILLLFSLFIVKAFVTPEHLPEGREYANIKNIFSNLGEIFYLPPVVFLKGHSWQFSVIYLYAEILSGILIVYYLYKQEFRKLLLFITFTVAFIIINASAYFEGESGIVLEKSFLPLSFFAGIAFTSDILKKTARYQWLLFVLFSAIIFLRVRDISKSAKSHRQRTEYIGSIVSYASGLGGQKFLLDRENLNIEKVHITWAMGCETLLLSSINSPDSAVTVFVMDIDNAVSDFFPEKINICNFSPDLWGIGKLNQDYFNLENKEGYKIINEKFE